VFFLNTVNDKFFLVFLWLASWAGSLTTPYIYLYRIPCGLWTGHNAGTANVKLFNKGVSVGSKTITYDPTSSAATTGIIQILVQQLGMLCDLLLVRQELPSVADVDALLSSIFQNETITTAIPTSSFEKFLESYRFLQGTGSANSMQCSYVMFSNRLALCLAYYLANPVRDFHFWCKS